MIKSFKCGETERLFLRYHSRKFTNIEAPARRKLAMIHAVTSVIDLMVPPGNQLQKLSGDRKGQYSIRINKQWRICFRWRNGDAHDVEIADYH
jgi:toxin HigB-1